MTWYIKDTDDGHGNGTCKKCKKISSKVFKSCVYCCQHKELKITEEYDHGWIIAFECTKCGTSGFGNDELIENYKVVRKLK